MDKIDVMEWGLDPNLAELCARAFSLYSTRCRDGIDYNRTTDPRARASVLANALIERGDGRAFILGRRIFDRLTAE
jgi:hypothetical protein